MNHLRVLGAHILCLLVLLPCCLFAKDEKPFCRSELIFPPETWHNHASCVVETPNGDLLVTWFHGSGERTADDVIIEGSRWSKRKGKWSERFTMSDTPGFPDGNPCLYIDPQDKLWLFHTVILANTWESALLKVKTSKDYNRAGPPRWDTSDVVLVKPGPEFASTVSQHLPELERRIGSMELTTNQVREARDFLQAMRDGATNKLYNRLGWMTRVHPVLLPGNRLLLPLYHDGFSFSLVAITENWGKTWETSSPIFGAGNIQPSIVPMKDGTLLAYMRDNGPPPKRLLESISRDGGRTWSVAADTQMPNSGTGAQVIRLRDGSWLLINNDTESGRHQLVVQMSRDDGKSWPWKRYLEKDNPGIEAGRFHYPSIIQARDGTIHATYSYHLHGKHLAKDVDGDPAGKSIKHAHFNTAWVMAGQD